MKSSQTKKKTTKQTTKQQTNNNILIFCLTLFSISFGFWLEFVRFHQLTFSSSLIEQSIGIVNESSK